MTGELLKFPEQERYRELLLRAADRLDAAATELMEIGVNAAMAGPWREWADRQPVGTILLSECDLLPECGDQHLLRLSITCTAMRGMADTLRSGSG